MLVIEHGLDDAGRSEGDAGSGDVEVCRGADVLALIVGRVPEGVPRITQA